MMTFAYLKIEGDDLSLGLPFIFVLADNIHKKNTSGNHRIEHVQFEHVAEQPVFYGAVISSFKSIHEWLFSICDNRAPEKPIAEFRINFLESAGQYTVFLYGINTYSESKNRTISRIEFEPKDMYCQLPESEYKGMDMYSIASKLVVQIKEFTRTETFQYSFLAKSMVIYTEFNGQKIWENTSASRAQP